MPGPSVMVRILADMTGASKGMDDVANKGSSAASTMHTAFSGVLDQLNATGVLGPFGGALSAAEQALSRVAGHAHEIGPAMMGAGTAVAGVGLALQAAGSKDQAAHQQLQQAVENTGHSYEEYGGKVEAAIKHQENFGHTADDTQTALQELTQATNDPAKALDMLGTASDLAAAKHESLGQAANTLGKAYNGSTRVMKEFGVQVDSTKESQAQVTKASADHEKAVLGQAAAQKNLTDAQEAYNAKPTEANLKKLEAAQGKVTAANITAYTSTLNLNEAHDKAKAAADKNTKAIAELGDKLKGQASAGASTFSGHLDAMKAKVEDSIAQFGQKYGPALTTAGAAMTGVGASLEVAKAATQAFKDQTILSTAATKIATAGQWLFNAAMDANIIVIIVIALVALVAAVILAYNKVAWFRDMVKEMGRFAKEAFDVLVNAAKKAFEWLQQNWPLVLAILLGPFAVATLLIIENWQTILKFFKELPGKIAAFLVGIWDTAFAELTTVVTWLDQNVWQPMSAFFGAIPGDIAKLFVGVWDTALAAMTTVATWLENNVAVPVANFFRAIPGRMSSAAGDILGSAFSSLTGAAAWLETNVWNPISSFFTGLGGRIESAASGMWNGITKAFKASMNAVIDAWNGLSFTLPTIDIGPVHLGGETLSVPHIPHLAQGGLITQTGLIYAHAGEANPPAPAVGRLPPAVHVDNLNVSTELDVDLFMKRAAWAAQTARL